MFNPFKMFGGGMDVSAILAPMLPGIIKDALPKARQAFDQKALELENQLEEPLEDQEEHKEEIAGFLIKRGGKLQLNWVRLSHVYLGADEWSVEIADTLETIEDEYLIKSAMAELSQKPAPVKELPAEPKRLHEISEEVKQAPINPDVFEELPEVQARHDKYKNKQFVVYANAGVFEVVEGPMLGQLIWYGHQDEAIAQNWADAKNRELAE